MSRTENAAAQRTRYFKSSKRHTELHTSEGDYPFIDECEATVVQLFGPNDLTNGSVRCFFWYRGAAGDVAHLGEGRGVHRVLVGKPEGRRPLGRSRRRWEDNIKRDLQEVGGGCGDWMERAQGRDRWRAFVSRVMNFRVP
jgi:hypothetical protein